MSGCIDLDLERWSKIRNYHLNKLDDAKREGKVDIEILPLLETINRSNDYITTSSCYGRVLLLNEEGIPKKGKDIIIGKYHRPITLEELYDAISSVKKGVVWMNIESTIVHVVARSLSKALELYEVAYESGYKSSSLIGCSRRGVTLEILEREKITIPIYLSNYNFIYPHYFLNNLIKYIHEMFYEINTKMNRFIHNYIIHFKL